MIYLAITLLFFVILLFGYLAWRVHDYENRQREAVQLLEKCLNKKS